MTKKILSLDKTFLYSPYEPINGKNKEEDHPKFK
jgi:hypothetical protein